METQVKYSGLEDRRIKIKEQEAKGLRMLFDNFEDPNWKHGDPIIGTMTFTDEPEPVILPPEPSPLEKDVAQLKLDVEKQYLFQFPVGAVYLNVTGVNPSTELGYGTWSQISQGQFLVGQKATDTDFDVAEETGGAKTHTHTDHPATATSEADVGATKIGNAASTATLITHKHDTPVLTHNSPSHLPPYFVVYIFKRTA